MSFIYPPLYIGASASTPGIAGLVPPPGAGNQLKFLRGDGAWTTNAGGDVFGPASATDNAAVRFDGITGKIAQDSVLIIADTGGLSGFTGGAGITFDGNGTIAGFGGAVTLTASGTNQSITLTPSGTGSVVVPTLLTLSSTIGTSAGGILLRDTNIFSPSAGNMTAQVGAGIFQVTNTTAGSGYIAKFTDSSTPRTFGIYNDGGGVSLGSVTNHALGFFTNNGAATLMLGTGGALTHIGTNVAQFGATAAATIGVSADTTGGVFTFVSPSAGSFLWKASGGATAASLTSAGVLTTAGDVTSTGANGGFIGRNVSIQSAVGVTRAYFTAPAVNGQVNLLDVADDLGVGLNVSTSNVLAFRTPANSADAAITAGAGTFSGVIAIGNTVAAGIGVSSTHKVTMSVGGSTYYLLASNV